MPKVAMIVPTTALNEMGSLRKRAAKGNTNRGSVELSVLAIATSTYLIETNDSQNPPNVTIQTDIKKKTTRLVS